MPFGGINMMRLLYDLSATQPSPESKFHGGGAYGEIVFFKLLEYLDKITLVAYYDARFYINPDIVEAAEKHSVTLYDLHEISVAEIIQKEKIDRVYSAMLNLNQKPPLGDVQVYATVHGLRTLEMPFDSIMLSYVSSLKEKIKFFLFMTVARKFYLKKLSEINGKLVNDDRITVITISNHSLASIKSFFPDTINKHIPVFASPTFAQLDNYTVAKNHDATNAASLHSFDITEKKFFLITSAARWTKNALRAVRAFDELFSNSIASDFKVVVTGVTNKTVFTKKLKNPGNFVFLEYVNRDVLQILTKNAYSFIYPSLNEGFGYPPIEAMQYGVAVAASGTSSIPEVCGDAVLYFDPYSISEIKNRIIQLLDTDIYNQLTEKSKKRYEVISAKQKRDLTLLAEYIIS